MKTKKDNRKLTWETLEAAIQSTALCKDPYFLLYGSWKKFIRFQDVFKIFAVDRGWVNNNLSIMFGHGGHGFVHEFIPINEIWIDSSLSSDSFDSCVIHEITEFKEMKDGKNYWAAHQIALKEEKKLKIQFMDTDTTFQKILKNAFKEELVSEAAIMRIVAQYYPGLSSGQIKTCTKHALKLYEKIKDQKIVTGSDKI